MKQRKRVFELARELGVSSGTIIHLAEALQLPVRRGIAELTPAQELRIRDLCERGDWRQRERRRRERPQAVPTVVVLYATCDCCELHFTYTDAQLRPAFCPSCADHVPRADEEPSRTIARLSDHERRLRTWFDRASRSATDYERRMKAAFESRQKWKAVLVEVALGHEPLADGHCSCGASDSPCPTVRMVESTNTGIARAIERLSGLSRKALDEELYGDEPWRLDMMGLMADDNPSVAGNHPAA